MSNTPPLEGTPSSQSGGSPLPKATPPKDKQAEQIDAAAQEQLLRQTGKSITADLNAITQDFERTFNPRLRVKNEMRSLVNGSNASERVVIGENTYSRVALRDFALGIRSLPGNIPIDSPASAGGASSAPENIVGHAHFDQTVFAKVDHELEQRGLKQHLSATNVLLSVASQSMWPTIELALTPSFEYSRSNVDTDGNPVIPMGHEGERSVNIIDNNVVITGLYELGPPIPVQPGTTNQQDEANRAKLWYDKRPQVWRIKYSVSIPLAELDKPNNLYGSQGCSIQYDVNIETQKGIPRRRDSIINPVKGYIGSFLGQKNQVRLKKEERPGGKGT